MTTETTGHMTEHVMEKRGEAIGRAVAELYAYAGRSYIEAAATPISVECHSDVTMVTFHGYKSHTSADVEVRVALLGNEANWDGATMREWDEVARDMGNWHEVV